MTFMRLATGLIWSHERNVNRVLTVTVPWIAQVPSVAQEKTKCVCEAHAREHVVHSERVRSAVREVPSVAQEKTKCANEGSERKRGKANCREIAGRRLIGLESKPCVAE